MLLQLLLLPFVADADSLTAPASATVPLTLLRDPLARCMDGTPGGYYFKPGSQSDKWIFTLQGGGECVQKARCTNQSVTHLGSSRFFAPNFTFWGDSAAHFIDASCVGNPVLCDYNFVFLPYCSQDLWSGQRETATPETYGFLFAGHLILRATLEALEDVHGLKSAKQIILTGNSAGGFGVYSNVDWLAARYPTAQVVGAPIAGYEFYAWPYTGPGHTSSSLADFRKKAMGSGAYNKLWDSLVPKGCLHFHPQEPGACLLPCFSAPHVSTPLYIVEAQGDSVVLMYHDWLPNPKEDPSAFHSQDAKQYMASFAANQSACLTAAVAAGHGTFNPACFIHTSFTNKIKIDGVNYKEGFLSWLGGKKAYYTDKCGVLCNPTCSAP